MWFSGRHHSLSTEWGKGGRRLTNAEATTTQVMVVALDGVRRDLVLYIF